MNDVGERQACADCRNFFPVDVLNHVLGSDGSDMIHDILLCDWCQRAFEICDDETKCALVSKWTRRRGICKKEVAIENAADETCIVGMYPNRELVRRSRRRESSEKLA